MDGDITNQDLYKLIQTVVEQNKKIQEESQAGRKEIKEEIRIVRSGILEELNILRNENSVLKEEIRQIKDKLEKVEKKSKKYNIVVYGLEEATNEISDIQKFLDIVNNTIKVDCRFADIRDIYRFGKPSEERRPRPLSVEFVSYKLKLELLRNCKELKGTNVYISQDLTHQDYKEQKLLREHLKIARENNCKAYIKNNSLYVDNKIYTLENLEKEKGRQFSTNSTTQTEETKEKKSSFRPGEDQDRSDTPGVEKKQFHFHTVASGSSSKKKGPATSTIGPHNKRPTRQGVKNNQVDNH